MVLLIYPVCYDGTQMLKQKMDYFSDPWNYIDILNISLGYYNCYLQWQGGTWELMAKVCFIFVILIGLIKTFFFMRIIMSFSYIVTMIIRVILDL